MQKPKLNNTLLRKLFIAASIRRWNDQATPIEFVELDKQAHKMIIAYILGKFEEKEHQKQIDWEKLIEYFIFEFFARVVLTDIKPPIFYALQKQHKKELADFVLQALEEEIQSYPFLKKIGSYFQNTPQDIESQILKAAHFYASKWEFDIIYNFNPHMYDVRNIKDIIDKEVENHYHLSGMQQIILFDHLKRLITLFGQLRFQKRWSQTPRIPPTSVLGHTLIVAICAYLLSFDIKACRQMRINHFLCGLFHDLPEVLTRDIISPIKKGIKGLDAQIKELESKEVEEKILKHLPQNISDDIKYYTENEFSNRYQIEGFIHYTHDDSHQILTDFNLDHLNPVYGKFLKICDLLSAFLEAKISITHGITSIELSEGANNILEKCGQTQINGIDLGYIFREFR